MSLKQTNIAEFTTIITLDEAKRQAYQSTSNNDTDLTAILTSLIKTAVLSCENYTWRQVVQADYEYRLDRFPSGILELPKPPVISVESVQYVSMEGNQTLDAANYRVDLISEPARLEPVSGWPSAKSQIDAVTITFTTGYNNDNKVPEPLKQGMLMLIKYLYENRDAVAISNSLAVHELPFGVKWMWDPYSLRRFT